MPTNTAPKNLAYLFKYHANGNDFVVTDNPELVANSNIRRSLSHRKMGIGCDQILFIHHNNDKTFCAFFNHDGSEASLCLNGLYVVASHLAGQNILPKTIYTQKSAYHINTKNTRLQIIIPSESLSPPQNKNILLPHTSTPVSCQLVNVGNQHLIISVSEQELQTFPLQEIGQSLQKSTLFPEGINVSIISYHAKQNTVTMRIFERGAGLTLSCGSAALAAFHSLETIHKFIHSLTMQQPGGNITISKREKELALESHSNFVAKVYWAQPQASPPSSAAQMLAQTAATGQGPDN